jgi:hypothetical protein
MELLSEISHYGTPSSGNGTPCVEILISNSGLIDRITRPNPGTTSIVGGLGSLSSILSQKLQQLDQNKAAFMLTVEEANEATKE